MSAGPMAWRNRLFWLSGLRASRRLERCPFPPADRPWCRLHFEKTEGGPAFGGETDCLAPVPVIPVAR